MTRRCNCELVPTSKHDENIVVQITTSLKLIFFLKGGAIWCIDVDWETKNFLSGAADNTIRMWDVCTGNILHIYSPYNEMKLCSIIVVLLDM